MRAYSRKNAIPRRHAIHRPKPLFSRTSPRSVSVSSISSGSGGARQTERFSMPMYRNLRGAMNPNRPYAFVQAVELSLGLSGQNGFTNSNGLTVYGAGLALSFSLQSGLSINGSSTNPAASALAQSGTFAGLFDQYRISAVEVTASVSRNSDTTTATVGTNPNAMMPIIHSTVDYDDATPPATTAYMLQRPENNIWQVGDKSITQKKWLIKPKFAVAAYQGAFTGYSQSTPGAWVDSSYPNVQYYGLKIYSDGFSGTAIQLGYVTFHCRFFLEFKNLI